MTDASESYTIINGWIAARTTSCNCASADQRGWPAHEQHCGWEPLVLVETALAAASLPAQQRPAPESGAEDEVIERAARAAHDAVRAHAPTNWVGSMRDEYWFPIARAVLAAAQPAPSEPPAGGSTPPARVWWSDELGWIWGFDGRYEADDWSSRWQVPELPPDAVELRTSEPPAQEAVEVLDGLLAEMRALADKSYGPDGLFYAAIALVEAERRRLGGEQRG